MNRGVVFDLDETLVDRRQTLDDYARGLLSEFDTDIAWPEEFVAKFHRHDGNGEVPREEFFSRLASELFTGVTARQLSAHFEANAWQKPHLFPGTTATLLYFRKRGWRVGIITNGGVNSQSAKIANSGLSELVHFSVISSVVGSRKPDREIFLYAAAQLGIIPNASWFVGDDPRADMWGASQFGLRTVWVERYKPWPDDLLRCYDARVTSMSEILEAVLGPSEC
jgi:HAD superfamily hydrolase (TIGR01549 family)